MKVPEYALFEIKQRLFFALFWEVQLALKITIISTSLAPKMPTLPAIYHVCIDCVFPGESAIGAARFQSSRLRKSRDEPAGCL